MASFRLYNIQLLPLDTSNTSEVGEIGYLKLFEHLQAKTTKAYNEKTLANSAYKLQNDTFISPLSIKIEDDSATGLWVKYHKTDSVSDLYTEKTLYNAPLGVTPVSNNYFFRFIFDYKTHRLGIEEQSGKLPTAKIFNDVVEYFLEPIAQDNFPKHTLTVNVISEAKALEEALKEAKGFRKAEAKITFPNGHELSQRLKHMRDNNIHTVKSEASSSKNALMAEIPDFLLEMIRASIEYGKSKFTYYKKGSTKQQNYSSEENPVKLKLRKSQKESEKSFLDRAKAALRASAEPQKEREQKK
ncbi:DUF4747 family protein [Salinicola sp. MIT1003]|uniref:DUF4747 family protein n=1 Tax=Salinicola sp. MIT1003 TaxID=1882734 RepID=UPI0009F527A9|nr:DUF4747 family protein [Salinicola sp. MIT1003]